MLDEIIYDLLAKKKELKEAENKALCARDIVLDTINTSSTFSEYQNELKGNVITVSLPDGDIDIAIRYNGTNILIYVDDEIYHEIVL